MSGSRSLSRCMKSMAKRLWYWAGMKSGNCFLSIYPLVLWNLTSRYTADAPSIMRYMAGADQYTSVEEQSVQIICNSCWQSADQHDNAKHVLLYVCMPAVACSSVVHYAQSIVGAMSDVSYVSLLIDLIVLSKLSSSELWQHWPTYQVYTSHMHAHH